MNFIRNRLDPRTPHVVPRSYRTYQYRVYVVKLWHKRPYFAINRSFLPGIASVGHIDPYNEKYQDRPKGTPSGS